MKTIPKRLFIFIGVSLSAALCATTGHAQSGGTYQITQSVIASGEISSGGGFSIENTTGQPLAGGTVQASAYSVQSGFWTPPNLAPTAAGVTVGGRVISANGQGVRNVSITLTGSNGVSRVARTASFGYFEFTDVRVGEIYIITVSSKRYVFNEPTRVISVMEELSGVNFIAEN